MSEEIWNRRLRATMIILEWIALAVGIIASVTESSADPLAFIAAGLGAIWVLATTAIPLDVVKRPFVLDVMTLIGVTLTMTSAILTGGLSSAYVLLAVTPAMYAGMFGGMRSGVSVALLTAMLYAAIPLASGQPLGLALPLASLTLALGAAVAQIRRIFNDLGSRVSEAEAANQRLATLESANQLLGRLAEISSRDEVSPIDVGRTALESITARFTNSAGSATLDTERGPILLARHGTIPDRSHITEIPLAVSDRRVGAIHLHTERPLDEATVASLHETVRPVALAFANAILLQDVTKSAVREERTRLARELHDEIGPSIASLGLSLDLALIQGVDQREINDHLSALRDRVAGLVEEVRATVTDLRSGTTGSLATRLEQLTASIDPTVEFAISLDERRPVRPSLSQNVYAIVGEAVRNAAKHSDGTSVQIQGWVDFDRGRIVVSDNGTGFDPSRVPEGHFGLIGMHERANESNIRLNVSASAAGTNVAIEWGTP